MDFAEAFEVPIVELIGGKEVSFPVLDIEDYLPWIAEVARQRRAKSKAMIPPKADPLDQFRMQRLVEFEEPNVDVIAEKVWTFEGAKKILDLSLSKAGLKNEAERTAVIKRIPPRRLTALAADVSALFERKLQAKATDQEDADPNSHSAVSKESESDPDPAVTGS